VATQTLSFSQWGALIAKGHQTKRTSILSPHACVPLRPWLAGRARSNVGGGSGAAAARRPTTTTAAALLALRAAPAAPICVIHGSVVRGRCSGARWCSALAAFAVFQQHPPAVCQQQPRPPVQPPHPYPPQQNGLQLLPVSTRRGGKSRQYAWDGACIKPVNTELLGAGYTPAARLMDQLSQLQRVVAASFLPRRGDVTEDYWEWLRWRLGQVRCWGGGGGAGDGDGVGWGQDPVARREWAGVLAWQLVYVIHPPAILKIAADPRAFVHSAPNPATINAALLQRRSNELCHPVTTNGRRRRRTEGPRRLRRHQLDAQRRHLQGGAHERGYAVGGRV